MWSKMLSPFYVSGFVVYKASFLPTYHNTELLLKKNRWSSRISLVQNRKNCSKPQQLQKWAKFPFLKLSIKKTFKLHSQNYSTFFIHISSSPSSSSSSAICVISASPVRSEWLSGSFFTKIPLLPKTSSFSSNGSPVIDDCPDDAPANLSACKTYVNIFVSSSLEFE